MCAQGGLFSRLAKVFSGSEGGERELLETLRARYPATCANRLIKEKIEGREKVRSFRADRK